MPSPLDQPEQPTPVDTQDGTTTGQGANVTDDQPPQPLAIEFGESSNATSESQNEPIQAMDVGEGDAIKLDALGPIIVNNDGTLSRIQNWYELGDIERERTVRLLVKKRNLVRMEKLRSEEEAEGQSGKTTT